MIAAKTTKNRKKMAKIVLVIPVTIATPKPRELSYNPSRAAQIETSVNNPSPPVAT
jgi:hypothetical protein